MNLKLFLNNKKCLFWGTLFLIINIFSVFILKELNAFFILNIMFSIAIVDFYKFEIPDLSIFFLLIISLFNFSIINLFFVIFIFFLTFYYWKIEKMGFGDVKLLSVLTIYYGYHIFYILILSISTAIFSNILKKKDKIPFGYHMFFGIILYYLLLLVIDFKKYI
jgi:leader peptidase (prepilin peptidase)/N-methyltransferase